LTNLFTDIGYGSLNRHGEELCGDQVTVVEAEDGSSVVVLADGLGSGVKACILATLTAKIIATMISRSMSIEDCISTMAATLPVCGVRKIAYSTFTIVIIRNNREAEIIQYDNPRVILLRQGKHHEFPLSGLMIGDKAIYRSKLAVREEDAFILMSDGAVHAGVGKTLNLGWQRENIIAFMEKRYRSAFAAKAIATVLLEECNRHYRGEPGDDTTVCAITIRPRAHVNLLVGPPLDPEKDHSMLSLFFGKAGKHIVCGGTTGGLAARFLGKELQADPGHPDPDIPPIAHIEGVDLVTEGVITINRVLEYARSYLGNNSLHSGWRYARDGASLVARLLFEEATDISFFVGRAINPAYQNPDLPIDFNIKMLLADELADCLKKMGKSVKISYF
jgi:hypothetical protein